MTQNENLKPQKLDEERNENILRPSFLRDFLGQEKLKENLEIFIKAAKNRSDALDHTLFYGPPGLGKTTLAQIISHELGVGFKSSAGPVISKSGDLAAILTNLQQGDILFIDEIHRLNKNVEEVLYSAMEDFKLDIIIGEGPAARAIKIDLPKFTLVGATTRVGLIANPLKDRFGIPLRINFYDAFELEQIVIRDARILQIEIEKDAAHEIAKRSRGTPRIAIRLLKRVRDFASHENEKIISQKLTDYALKRLEIDSAGLDASDYRYLKFIAKNYRGGPVGIETISAAIGEEKDTVEDTIEPYLIQQGFIEKTPRGRVLTETAFMHLGL
ncbi:MAG: Holliday junction DNA helicase RuvB [Alphaproteobacteria bacterium RIFCSPLOWO2_01_FULL_40_26]|nr:MAG: Holliday junction DNA helicase RuvB [Alphaproteobacteria bacterium RIFCSPHIGHO2_02_FULL_40_34]OFW94601.1 MAG: Holliday junction DNA helicase RuvB [Alphaproteobacteria bacterium RIFCSPLOWO2_01_FULL_40_26]OFX10068.1 MAG: Holliday junction DNA helicase RuvB [Alphaproteobacteria bacterium RIFCSPLOWO2_02_FULL_40_19]OFX11803.1 MAG: Holliday junction DNA helicase RuvB [Alphaproteobacteria bacterium RIFCSPLOWO2_12_FULL_40_11]